MKNTVTIALLLLAMLAVILTSKRSKGPEGAILKYLKEGLPYKCISNEDKGIQNFIEYQEYNDKNFPSWANFRRLYKLSTFNVESIEKSETKAEVKVKITAPDLAKASEELFGDKWRETMENMNALTFYQLLSKKDWRGKMPTRTAVRTFEMVYEFCSFELKDAWRIYLNLKDQKETGKDNRKAVVYAQNKVNVHGLNTYRHPNGTGAVSFKVTNNGHKPVKYLEVRVTFYQEDGIFWRTHHCFVNAPKDIVTSPYEDPNPPLKPGQTWQSIHPISLFPNKFATTGTEVTYVEFE